MEYYKDIKSTKDRRIVGRKGPRDLQKQAQAPDNSQKIIDELRSQVSMLMEELGKRPVAQEATGMPNARYTAEEFDEELIKQVSAALVDKEKFFEERLQRATEQIDSLKDKLEAKDAIIASKDETIQSLRLKGVSSEVIQTIEDPDRPQMETVFVDPSDKDDGKGMESHIKVESKEDTDIGDKVNKLKALIGGLPK